MKHKIIKATVLLFFGHFLYAANNNYINFSQNNPFEHSRLKFLKKEKTISLNAFLAQVNANPQLLKNVILNKLHIKKIMNETAYKLYSNVEINKWIDQIVLNKNFQKAFYYLFIDKNEYQFKNQKVIMPDYKDAFKYLAGAILETQNPIASFIGSYYLFFYFDQYNNFIKIKYGKLFSEPLYKTNKSCLGIYMYGTYFMTNSPMKDFSYAHQILFNGYKKCKKLELKKGLPHIVTWSIKIQSAKAKALVILTNGYHK